MVVTTGGLKSCRNQVPLRRSRAAAGPARGHRLPYRQEVWWSVEHVQAHYRRVFGTIAAHFPRGVGPQQLHPEHNSNTDPRLLGPENPEKELSLASPWRAPNSRSSCHATSDFLGPNSVAPNLEPTVSSAKSCFWDKLAGFFWDQNHV